MDAFSNVSIMTSEKLLPKNILNSNNRIKEELKLCFPVENQKAVKDMKKVLEHLLLKAKEFFLGLLFKKNICLNLQKIPFAVLK